MQVTILGSGTNIHPRRAGAGYLVQTDHSLLLDFGPRTLMNLIKTGVDRHGLTHLLFSHFHADHFSDVITYLFDEIYYSRHIAPRPDLTLIGPRGTRALFETIVRTFPSFDKAAFRLRVREIGDRPFWIGRTKVAPRSMSHVRDLHCVGYRLDYAGHRVAYSGDTEYCDGVVRLCADADLAILDCSFPAQHPGPAHMTAEHCGRVAREAGAGRLILSHFYPIAERYDVKAQAGEAFSGKITKARDLMTLQL